MMLAPNVTPSVTHAGITLAIDCTRSAPKYTDKNTGMIVQITYNDGPYTISIRLAYLKSSLSTAASIMCVN